MDLISYILSRKYVDNSISGISGVLAGKNCTIYSSTKSGDTTTIVFKWTADDGTERTTEIQVKDGETPAFSSVAITGGHKLTFTTQDPAQSISFNVMDGAKGDMGISVVASNVDENNNLTLTLSNGNVINAGKIKAVTTVDNALSTTSSNPVENKVITNALNNKVDKEAGKGLFSDEEKAKLNNIEDGAQVNVLEKLIINGQEATITDKSIALTLITSAVSNLQNYYLKTETYTKQEVEDLIGSTVGVTIEIVEQLPTEGQSNVIYFLPTETEGVYSQYIYSNNSWILIGSTTVDLSNYYTKAQVDALLNGKQNVLTIDSFPTALSNNPVASGGVYTAIARMQPQFQFANMPTASASNLGFVYQYTGATGTYTQNMFYRCVYDDVLGEYKWVEVIFHATVTVDSAISGTSTNPVQNKVIKEALDTKQDIMQYSTMPSAQDNLGKIVQYIGTNTANYTNGYFYKAIYDSTSDVYLWTVIKFSADMLVDNALSTTSKNPVQNKVITQKFGEYKTAFTGTEEEWNALTPEEQNAYDIINITNDGDVLNLGVYLEKTTAMPVASEDVEHKIYLYTGTTTQNYKKGVVYQCVSDGQDHATYSWVALIDFGTASIKNSTDRVSPNNTDLVESQSVYSAINTALSSIYTPRGNITCAELTSSLLIAANVGNVYETSDSGTTTALFLQGAGHPIAVGSNVGIINAGQGRILFNLMANAFDLTGYQKKDLVSAVEGETTVEGALGALSINKQPKTLTTSVESQTTVEGALGALSTNKATQAEVNDIVNVLGAKNIIPLSVETQTINGVTLTVQDDGSIVLNGTATANTYIGLTKYGIPLESGKCILSGVSGGSMSSYFLFTAKTGGATLVQEIDGQRTAIRSTNGDSAIFDITKMNTTIGSSYVDPSEINIRLGIENGYTCDNVLIKPMIRLASITDDTYEPYAKTNQELTAENEALTNQANDMVNVYGAKNLIPYPYYRPSGYTSGNMTGTYDANGVITINKTADTTTRYFALYNGEPFLLPNTTYILSLELTNATNTSVYVAIGTHGVDMTAIRNKATGKYDVTFTTPSTFDDNLIIGLYYGKDIVETNAIVKVMLRLASIQDDTYVPYSMTNREMTPYVQAISNPNLLDNPWFTVNQRGQSSYSSGYCADRWQLLNNIGTVTINSDNSITIQGQGSSSGGYNIFRQIFEYERLPIIGKPITLSVMLGDGTIISSTGKVEARTSSWVAHVPPFYISDNIRVQLLTYTTNSNYEIYLTATDDQSFSVTIKAIKLELGSVSTLAMDTAPNYATELLKCQRYFNRFWYSEVGWAHCVETNSWAVIAHLPCVMRAAPTISLNGTIGISVATNDNRNGTPTIQNYNEGGEPINIGFSLNGITGTAGEVGRVFIGNSYLNFSADL